MRSFKNITEAYTQTLDSFLFRLLTSAAWGGTLSSRTSKKKVGRQVQEDMYDEDMNDDADSTSWTEKASSTTTLQANLLGDLLDCKI